MCDRPGNSWPSTISRRLLRFWAPMSARAQSMAAMTFDSSLKRNLTELLPRRLVGNWPSERCCRGSLLGPHA